MADGDRSEYTDGRLRDKFHGIERELDTLRTTVTTFPVQMAKFEAKLDDVAVNQANARSDIRDLSRTVVGFLASLFIALVAGIVCVVVFL